MTDTTIKVGDKVKIKHLLSWGVCRVTAIHKYGRKIRYAVARLEGDSITRLLGLKKKQLKKAKE